MKGFTISEHQCDPKNCLTECGFTFTPAEADRGGMTLMKIKMLLCCIRRELGGPGQLLVVIFS